MVRYIVKRLVGMIPVLLIVSIVVFLLVRIVPADAVGIYMAGHNIPITEENRAFFSEFLGLDKPLVVQYALWLKSAVMLDFGTSYSSKSPVLPLIWGSFGNTIQLTLAAMVWILILTPVFAIFSVQKPEGFVDNLTRVFTMLGIAVPSFVLGYLFIHWFSLRLKILPPSGKQGLKYFFMPSFVLACGYIASYSRMLRNSMLSAYSSDYVQYADLRGLRRLTITSKHVMRNALLPVVGSFGISFGNMIAGSVVVENIFAWPGLGRLITASITARDYPVIQAYVVFMAVVFLLANLISDVICAMLDPRIRLGASA